MIKRLSYISVLMLAACTGSSQPQPTQDINERAALACANIGFGQNHPSHQECVADVVAQWSGRERRDEYFRKAVASGADSGLCFEAGDDALYCRAN
jgi:hypothetical protein